jgi:diguanylate cyclase (GGDEF)-like protein
MSAIGHPDPKSNMFFWLALFGLVAPIITFGIAVSGLAAQTKTVLLAAIAAAYCTAFLYAYSRAKIATEAEPSGTGLLDDVAGVNEERNPKMQTIRDTVTGLPNERAFMLVLEHQLAECQRERDERPLSVVSMDVRDTAELRSEFGDEVVDRAVCFVADIIRSNMRSMDFLAGFGSGDFGLILPKADRKNADEALTRIANALNGASFPVNEERTLPIAVICGTATFWQDGESAEQLLRHAQLEKQRAKAEHAVKIAEATDEYVH